jgi:hypothetical protein
MQEQAQVSGCRGGFLQAISKRTTGRPAR